MAFISVYLTALLLIIIIDDAIVSVVAASMFTIRDHIETIH